MIPKLRNCQNLRREQGIFVIVCGICRSVDKKLISKWQNWPKKPRKFCTKIKPEVDLCCRLLLRESDKDISYYILNRIVKEPYTIAWSKSAKRKYWCNLAKRSSVFECPKDAAIDFKAAFEKRYYYKMLLVTWQRGSTK